MRWLLLFGATGCGQLLGLSEPKLEADASMVSFDGSPDGSPDGPAAGIVHIVMGGSGEQGIVTSEPAGIACPGTCDFTFPPGTEVTLSATQSADTFTGFVQGGCTGGQTCTITPDGDTLVFARYFKHYNIIFTSSTVQKPGAFDSAEAADALCDQLAAAAGLIDFQYVAWLSTSTSSARQRVGSLAVSFPSNLWLRPDGKLFANGFSDFETGRIRFPARLDEFGRDVGDDAIVATDTIGTGLAGGGTHCQDWASEGAAPVLAGEPAGGTSRWTAVSTIGCDQDAHVYCLSGVSGLPVPTGPLGASVLFVSTGTLAGNAGVAAADALCNSEANAAGLPNFVNKALITPGAGKPVNSRFNDISFTNDPVERPDGIQIATDMDALLNGAPFEAAPNVTAANAFLDVPVWIGAGSFDQFESDCTGWTSNAGFGATRPAATTRGVTFFQQTACNQQAHVMCINAIVIATAK